MAWRHVGGSTGRFAAERYACLRDATYTAGSTWTVFPIGGGLVPVPLDSGGPSVNEGLFIACMQARGYVLEPR